MGSAPAGGGTWKHDLPASFVVFLVALPLSMGIALASGAPIVAGLTAAVVGGIVVGLLSGAPLQVSGPAAGLAVLVFGYVQKFGFAAVCSMAVIAGVIQLVLGAAKVARVALAVSPAVLHGMLAGIGIQIVLAQFHVAAGATPAGKPLENIFLVDDRLGDAKLGAVVGAAVTIAVMLIWPRLKILKKVPIPAPLIGILAATAIVDLFNLTAPRVELPANFLGSISHPSLPTAETLTGILLGGLTIAIVASAESLLCAVATDQLHTGPRANLDKELMAQGAGNFLSGLLGGLPITGVIVRSTANIEAGARGRWSGVLHGVWMLIAVMLLGRWLGLIPLGALAGLLIVVGFRLVNWKHIRDIKQHGELVVYVATVVCVVFWNLLGGIAVGVVVALGKLLWKLARVEIKVTHRPDVTLLDISGALTFLTVPKLSAALAALPAGSSVDIDLNLTIIDHAALEVFDAWKKGHERTGGKVVVDDASEWTNPRKAVA